MMAESGLIRETSSSIPGKREGGAGRGGGRGRGGDYKLRQSYATCVSTFLSDLPDSSINNQMV